MAQAFMAEWGNDADITDVLADVELLRARIHSTKLMVYERKHLITRMPNVDELYKLLSMKETSQHAQIMADAIFPAVFELVQGRDASRVTKQMARQKWTWIKNACASVDAFTNCVITTANGLDVIEGSRQALDEITHIRSPLSSPVSLYEQISEMMADDHKFGTYTTHAWMAEEIPKLVATYGSHTDAGVQEAVCEKLRALRPLVFQALCINRNEILVPYIKNFLEEAAEATQLPAEYSDDADDSDAVTVAEEGEAAANQQQIPGSANSVERDRDWALANEQASQDSRAVASKHGRDSSPSSGELYAAKTARMTLEDESAVVPETPPDVLQSLELNGNQQRAGGPSQLQEEQTMDNDEQIPKQGASMNMDVLKIRSGKPP